jgi:hypothetical protein
VKFLTVVAAFLIATPSFVADAKPIRHGKRHFYHSHKPRPPASDWYPHDINELPFDSPHWFDQMLRENRRNPG